MLKIYFFLIPVLGLLLNACVTTQADVDRLQDQITALEEEQQKNQELMQQRLEEYEEQLALHTQTLEERVSEVERPMQSKQAELWAEMESLRVDVATLSGDLEVLERQISHLRDEDQDWGQIIQDLQEKTRELDRTLHTVVSRLGLDLQEEETAFIPEKVPEEEMETARTLYQRALDAFYNRDYEQAQSLWEDFAENFPEHDLVSNAYFWQGEAFYQMQEYAEAVLAYQEVISNYPDSNKITPSMLKQGMSFIYLGREEAGELILNELLQEYPDSAEAKRAQAFMSDQDL